jgi:two-component system sensor kinase FixL
MSSMIGAEGTGAGASAERLRQLVETCQDAVLFIDRNGRIKMANPATCRMFGYDHEQLRGADVRMLMGEPYASRHQGYIDHYEATGTRKAIGFIRQVSAVRSSGEEFPIELSVTQIAEEGDGARYGAFIRDVSDKARLQAELMERERAATVGTTASMLVHEIGNPLNNMALQLQALRRKVARVPDVEDAVAKVDSCLGEVARLSRLVQEFRALSGRRRLNRRRVPLTSLLEGVPASVLGSTRGVALQREFADGGVLVLADPDKMQQVLLNLCHNAIDAMEETGGTLTLRTQVEGTDYVLEVSDTGTGILPGTDIFAPFVTTKPDGTGLGLAICSEIVREHGGMLTFETSAGRGTTFRLRIPL